MRIFVLDVPCEDCEARSGEPCVKPNGAPFASCYSGGNVEPGPVTWTWTDRAGVVHTETGRPMQYHAARRALFKHTRALVDLGAHARA